MYHKVLFLYILSVLVCTGNLTADIVTINPSDDASVNSGSPGTNNGSSTGFSVGYAYLSAGTRRAYLKFDLSSVPVGRKVVSATLCLQPSYISLPEPNVGAHYLHDDSCDEGTITWNNAPTAFDGNAVDTHVIHTGDNYWTVTEDVFDAYRTDGVYSVVLKLADEGVSSEAIFMSKETVIPDLRPQLEIEYVIEYSGGSGTTQYPYLIATAEDMNAIGAHPEDWDANFLMTADINLSEYGPADFNVIGTLSEPFIGVFDGNGHTISNFTYESNGVHAIGLFGMISGLDAAIRDLGLIGADVNGGAAMAIGSLVGNIYDATISGCYCIDCNVCGGDLVGGLVGMNASGTVSGCYATGQVEASETAGGLSGFNGGEIFDCYASASVLSTESLSAGGLIGFQNANGTAWDCYATGAVRSLSGGAGGFVGGHYGMTWGCHASGDAQGIEGVGGFAGASFSNSSISGCYSTGSATGTLFVGGLVGYGGVPELSDSYAVGSVTAEDAVGGLLGISIRATVSNCYAVGVVEGDSNVGGLVGLDGEDTWAGTFAACFWDSDINPDVNGIGNKSEPNVMGKSTAEMQTESTFTDYGWDFVNETVNGPNDIWTIHETVDYPKHVWPLVNFIGWYEVDFLDYAFFANYWGDTNCSGSNDCEGTDLDFSDAVDWKDLKIFCQHWLEETQ